MFETRVVKKSGNTMSEICPVCKNELVPASWNPEELWCSEYCATVTGAEIAEYRKAKPGDWCVFPCTECKKPIEGVLGDGCCDVCAPKVEIRELKALLQRALPLLKSLTRPARIPHPASQALIQEIEKKLKV